MKTLLFLFLLVSTAAFAGSFDIISNTGRSGHGYYDEQSGTYDIYYSDGQYVHGHINSGGYFQQMDNRNDTSIGYYDKGSGNFYTDGEYGVVEGSGNYYKYDENSEKVVEHGVIILY